MQEFKELIKIVTKYRLKKIDKLASGNEGKDKYARIAGGIADGTIKNDEDAAKLLNVKDNSIYYRTFKSRLKEKLINNLLFLEFNTGEISNYNRAIYICSRNLHAIKILRIFPGTSSSMRLAEKTIQKALKFELAEFIMVCAKAMKSYYAFLGQMGKFQYYNVLFEKYLDIYIAENKAETIYQILSAHFGNASVITEEDISFCNANVVQITEIRNLFDTYVVNVNYFRVKGMFEFVSEQYKEAVKTWDSFDTYIEKYKEFQYNVRMAESALQKMDCYLHMHDFENSKLNALKCDKYFTPFSSNWFIYKEYEFLLAMHTQKYREAEILLTEIMTNTGVRLLGESLYERWKIFEAYIYLLKQTGKLSVNATKSAKKFRLSTFLNATPIYSKEKKGRNIAILMVQILSMIFDQKFPELSEKIQALKKYTSRYLKTEPGTGKQLFLKMIFTADKCNYALKETDLMVKPDLELLRQLQFKYVSNLEGLEIVPYLHLWDMVRDHLKK